MKRQIRKGVFETNSSSTHSLTICSKTDYDRWYEGETYLFKGSGWGYREDMKPVESNFYTLKECIEFLKSSEFPPAVDFNWDNKEEVDSYLRDYQFYSYDNYNDDYFEEFEESYTCKSGEEIIAFGYYGYDG